MTRSTFAKLSLTAAVSLALAWAPLARAGDMNAEMQQMFNDIGAMSSVTGPSAYRAQSLNLYMGGDMQVRTPIRSYQLWNFTLPSVKSSCGGIDAFLGSFSHINTAQFKEMLQQIANNTVGLLFQAALSSIQPLIASKIEFLQNVIQSANIGNVNSCNAAKSIVGGVSAMTGINAYDACVSMGAALGWDQNEARAQCKNDPVTPQQTVAATGDPVYAPLAVRDVNLMWEALSKTSFTKEEKETFINIAGTFIVFKTDAGGVTPAAKRVEPMNDEAFALLLGNAPGSTADKVKLAWWTCADADCITMDPNTTVEVTPFSVLIEQRLKDIDGKLRASAALSAAEIGFINTTTLPVWKMLTLGYSAPDATLSDLLIQRYKMVIALDYAQTFLRRAMREAVFYLGQVGLRSGIEEERLKELMSSLANRVNRATQEYATARSGVRDMNAFTDDLQTIERSLMTAVPFRIKAALDFSSSTARVGR